MEGACLEGACLGRLDASRVSVFLSDTVVPAAASAAICCLSPPKGRFVLSDVEILPHSFEQRSIRTNTQLEMCLCLCYAWHFHKSYR